MRHVVQVRKKSSNALDQISIISKKNQKSQRTISLEQKRRAEA